MSKRIEDYAFLSDTESSALVSADGSIDWLTFPRFDSPACFAALLGTADNGRWILAPQDQVLETRRSYRPGTLVLDTEVTTARGRARITECMPVRSDERLDVVRQVTVLEGRVPMHMELVARMDYGSTKPWARHTRNGVSLTAGADALILQTAVDLDCEGLDLIATFELPPGRSVDFDLAWVPSYRPWPASIDVDEAIEDTESWWKRWSGRRARFDRHDDAIGDALVVLKGLTYAPSGGIVAAATTSLPETIGGARNWDYRYCWLRDATFTLRSFIDAGCQQEAVAWRDWLLRAVAGDPGEAQIMYGPAGERRLPESELEWLAGYEASTPVRVGNAAHAQVQLDVYGEVLNALGQAELVQGHPDAWDVARALAESVVERWQEPDDGIWEMRGGRRHFTHSKVMAWVALDSAIAIASRLRSLSDDHTVRRWRAVRAKIRADVLDHGVDAEGIFRQELGGGAIDASLLLVPLVGFLPADDPRVVNTTDAIVRHLDDHGFLHRYDPDEVDDGVDGQEGTFLLCTLWLAQVYAAQGRHHDAEEIFGRVLSVRNDVGLLSEMYDPVRRRLLGNFPQAFSHTGVAAAGISLSRRAG